MSKAGWLQILQLKDKAVIKDENDAYNPANNLIGVFEIGEQINEVQNGRFDMNNQRITLIDYLNPTVEVVYDVPPIVHQDVEAIFKNEIGFAVTSDTVGLTAQQILDGFVRITIIDWT